MRVLEKGSRRSAGLALREKWPWQPDRIDRAHQRIAALLATEHLS